MNVRLAKERERERENNMMENLVDTYIYMITEVRFGKLLNSKRGQE